MIGQYTVRTELLVRRNDAARGIIQAALFDPRLKNVISREITEEITIPGTTLATGREAAVATGREAPSVASETTARATITTSADVPTVTRYKGPVLPIEKRGTISFMDNGKRQVWNVPAWLENEAKHLSTLGITDLERVGQIVNAIPRAALTSYNPAFFTANFIFDTMTLMTTRGILPPETLKNRADKIIYVAPSPYLAAITGYVYLFVF